MNRFVSICVLALLSIGDFSSQAPAQASKSPKDIVDELWRHATVGDLLTSEGWQKSRAYFTHPVPGGNSKSILVVSNEWGPPELQSQAENNAQVILWIYQFGEIDPTLKFKPAKIGGEEKVAIVYHLAYVKTHYIAYKSDGKTLSVDKEVSGPMSWEIEDPPGPPWTTVNTAIRYVLEKRNNSTDPLIKKNADETISSLLKLH